MEDPGYRKIWETVLDPSGIHHVVLFIAAQKYYCFLAISRSSGMVVHTATVQSFQAKVWWEALSHIVGLKSGSFSWSDRKIIDKILRWVKGEKEIENWVREKEKETDIEK